MCAGSGNCERGICSIPTDPPLARGSVCGERGANSLRRRFFAAACRKRLARVAKVFCCCLPEAAGPVWRRLVAAACRKRRARAAKFFCGCLPEAAGPSGCCRLKTQLGAPCRRLPAGALSAKFAFDRPINSGVGSLSLCPFVCRRPHPISSHPAVRKENTPWRRGVFRCTGLIPPPRSGRFP